MSYNVYRVSFTGMPRDHHAIFVETNDDESGWIFQVIGNIQSGMRHNDKSAKKPEDSASYHDKVLIGRVSHANFSRIKPICDGIPAPKKQFNGAERINPREPLRRCQEWTKEAINALEVAGVLEK